MHQVPQTTNLEILSMKPSLGLFECWWHFWATMAKFLLNRSPVKALGGFAYLTKIAFLNLRFLWASETCSSWALSHWHLPKLVHMSALRTLQVPSSALMAPSKHTPTLCFSSVGLTHQARPSEWRFLWGQSLLSDNSCTSCFDSSKKEKKKNYNHFLNCLLLLLISD